MQAQGPRPLQPYHHLIGGTLHGDRPGSKSRLVVGSRTPPRTTKEDATKQHCLPAFSSEEKEAVPVSSKFLASGHSRVILYGKGIMITEAFSSTTTASTSRSTHKHHFSSTRALSSFHTGHQSSDHFGVCLYTLLHYYMPAQRQQRAAVCTTSPSRHFTFPCCRLLLSLHLLGSQRLIFTCTLLVLKSGTGGKTT